MSALPFQVAGDADVNHAAVLYPAEVAATRHALVVLAHGAGAGQSHPFMVRFARGLADRGVDIVTFDFPYMQAGRRSPDRAPVLEGTFRRVVAAAAKHPRVQAGKLFIGGKSMGGRMATHLAAARDDWPAEAPPLSGVIVFGYPLNPPGGPSKRSPDRVSHLERIAVPILIAQGTRDSFGGPDEIRRAMPRAQVFEVPTGDHSFSIQKSAGRTQAQMDEEILAAVIRFIDS
jgi:predicted alpha/beta-hydrolase family hydrolase